MKRRKLLYFIISVILAACTGINPSSDKQFGYAVADFSIWGDESSGLITCHFLFKNRYNMGKGIFIPKPGKLLLDGVELKSDSTRFSGYYYDFYSQTQQFSKKHSIIFIDPDKRIFRQQFEFIPLVLETEIESNLRRAPILLTFGNLPSIAKVRLVLTDTSFTSKGVNEIVSVINGKAKITSKMLYNLKKGPVTLEIFKEEEQDLFDHTPYQGQISLSYHLQREFELED